MCSKKTPLVSVICLTYNHEKYIEDCLNGFVMQKTDFPFEVLVHDDASTDNTAQIVRRYAEKYPDIIKPIFQKENLFQKKIDCLKNFVYPEIKGTYVALCEGDDYWTDELKLQKQIDFLKVRHDYSICFHPVRVHYENGSQEDGLFPNEKERFYKTTFELSDLIERNFIQTNSVVYRWRFHKDSYENLPENINPGDWFGHLLHAQVGKIGFMPDVMAVYRKNEESLWTGALKTKKWFVRCIESYLRFLKEKERWFHSDETDVFLFALASCFQKCKDEENLLERLRQAYPEELRKIKEIKHTKIKYLFFAMAKFLSFGKARQFFKKKKNLYAVLKK